MNDIYLKKKFDSFIKTHEVYFKNLSVENIAKMAYYAGIKDGTHEITKTLSVTKEQGTAVGGTSICNELLPIEDIIKYRFN